MFGNSKKITLATLGLGVSILAFSPALARDVGDSNYPVAGQEKMSKEEMQSQHQKMLQKIERDSQSRLNALDERYNDKVTSEDIHHKEMMEKRKEEAKLTKERMIKRTQMDRAYQAKKSELEYDKHTKTINRYYQAQKDLAEDRKDGIEHYQQIGTEPMPREKKQDMRPILLEGEKGQMPPPPPQSQINKNDSWQSGQK